MQTLRAYNGRGDGFLHSVIFWGASDRHVKNLWCEILLGKKKQ